MIRRRRRSIGTDVNTERHTDGRMDSLRPFPSLSAAATAAVRSVTLVHLCVHFARSSATLQPRRVVHLVASLATRSSKCNVTAWSEFNAVTASAAAAATERN